MKTMIIAAAAVLGLSVGSAAYAGEGSEGGATATALAWQAANGSARVPASEWFAANAAQRNLLSRQYAGVTYPTNGNAGTGALAAR